MGEIFCYANDNASIKRYNKPKLFLSLWDNQDSFNTVYLIILRNYYFLKV